MSQDNAYGDKIFYLHLQADGIGDDSGLTKIELWSCCGKLKENTNPSIIMTKPIS